LRRRGDDEQTESLEARRLKSEVFERAADVRLRKEQTICNVNGLAAIL
jgi:hypothetical protein